MILYHGSNMIIENIDFKRCRPYKDFGQGFYCTEIKEQAELMAKRVANIYGGIPYVTIFELNEEVYKDDNLYELLKYELSDGKIIQKEI